MVSDNEKMKRFFYRKNSTFTLQELKDRFKGEIAIKDITDFFNKQDITKAFKGGDKKADKVTNHFQIKKPGRIQEADVLYLPKDKGYKYALTVIDQASRFKGAEPLKKNDSETVKKAYMTILRRFKKALGKDWERPEVVRTDGGSEFKSHFHNYLVNATPPVQHKVNPSGHHLAFVESFNRNLGRVLFNTQSAKELRDSDVNREWVTGFQKKIDAMNNTKTRMINQKPKDAVKEESVDQPQNKNYADADKHYNVGDRVVIRLKTDQVLDVPTGKIKIDSKGRRATDPKFTIKEYEVVKYYKPRRDPGAVFYHELREVESGRIFNKMFTYFQLKKVPKKDSAVSTFKSVLMEKTNDDNKVVTKMATTPKQFDRFKRMGYKKAKQQLPEPEG